MSVSMTRSTPSEPVTSDAPWTTRRLLRWIQDHLDDKDVDAPRVCAELLVGHSIGSERLKLYMEPDRVASDSELTSLRGLVARAARHEPVQYLVGSWPFFGREFEVSPCTLIPRPATETLVEAAMDFIAARGVHERWRILDLCTGTGCIAVSVAASLAALRAGPVSERFQAKAGVESGLPDDLTTMTESVPTIDLEHRPVAPDPVEDAALTPEDRPPISRESGPLAVIATDIVEDALALLHRNAARHGVDGLIETRCGSLFDALDGEEGPFDLICANPPYVSDAEYEELDANVRDYEPATALRGGPHGLDFIRPILEEAPRRLVPGGLLLVEIADAGRDAVLEIARAVPGLHQERILTDHEGYSRVLVAHATT